MPRLEGFECAPTFRIGLSRSSSQRPAYTPAGICAYRPSSGCPCHRRARRHARYRLLAGAWSARSEKQATAANGDSHRIRQFRPANRSRLRRACGPRRCFRKEREPTPSAFFSTAGTERLDSGVTKRTAFIALTRSRNVVHSTGGWPSISRL
jgi:hypothetical protein